MINISHRSVGKSSPPFIIAEMSGNHNQSLERALQIVDAAAAAGAHALKIQTYTPETMTLNLKSKDFSIEDEKSLWKGYNLFELYQHAHTPWEWHKPIFDRCRKSGLIGFSSPFDFSAVEYLEKLDVPCYKIASFEMTDIPLIKRVAATGKPMIISTGMATAGEIEESVLAARSAGCQDIILLKCTSTYPASAENTNIRTIPHMRELFQCQVGLSDHTMGSSVAVAAVALGATVIEKHFTLSRADGGVDSAFSLEPAELKNLVFETKQAWQALGEISYGPIEAEKNSLKFRRSLYICKDVKKGDVLGPDNLRSIRPGYGLPPKYLENLIGKKVARDIKRGTAVTWDLLTAEND